MIIVSGKVKSPPGALEKHRDLMKSVIAETRKEPGCIGYHYGVDVLDPDTMIILEYWKDWASLEKLFTQPHMGPWIKALGEIKMVEQNVSAAETSETRQLMS